VGRCRRRSVRAGMQVTSVNDWDARPTFSLATRRLMASSFLSRSIEALDGCLI